MVVEREVVAPLMQVDFINKFIKRVSCFEHLEAPSEGVNIPKMTALMNFGARKKK